MYGAYDCVSPIIFLTYINVRQNKQLINNQYSSNFCDCET